MLLSTHEIAQICHEQNRAYCRLIKSPWQIDSWQDLDLTVKVAVERKVVQVMDGKVTEPYVQGPADAVHRIMEGMFLTMVEILMEL